MPWLVLTWASPAREPRSRGGQGRRRARLEAIQRNGRNVYARIAKWAACARVNRIAAFFYNGEHYCLLDVTLRKGLPSWCEQLASFSICSGMESEVTVGIGALCNGGDRAVIATDTRALFPRSNVRPHDETGKTWDFNIPNPLIAAVAGRLGDCATVVSELNRLLRECSKRARFLRSTWKMRFVTLDLRGGQDLLIGKYEWPTELLLNSGKLGKFQVAKLINLFTTRYVL